MTRAEFAQHCGVSKAAVTQWASAGRVVCDSGGRVLVKESEQLLAETRSKAGGKPRTTETPATSRSAPRAVLDEATLTGAKTAQARARARLDEIELAERMGRLIDRERSDRAILDAVGPILTRFESLGARAAPKVVGQTDVRRIADAIDDEVLALRQELADTLKAMAASGKATKQ